MSTTAAPARQGIPLTPDPRAVECDWYRGFIRAATARVIGKLRKTSAAEIQRANWPNDRSAELIVRNPVEPTKAGDFPGSSVS
jgi:hypothetical protein